jgi:hypothetical protein
MPKEQSPPSDVFDAGLIRDLSEEEQLIRQGFVMGDLDDNLAGQGWTTTPYQADADSGVTSVFER